MILRGSKLRPLLISLAYAGIVSASFVLAFLLRFDFAISQANLRVLFSGCLLAIAVKTSFLSFGQLNRPIWRFADFRDLCRIILVNGVASFGFTAVGLSWKGIALPSSIYVSDFLVCSILTTAFCLGSRFYSDALFNARPKNNGKAILIYGAGVAGTMLVREIRSNAKLDYNLVGFLDDDLSKRDATLMGVPVLGTGRDASRVVAHYSTSANKIEEIIIAIPSANDRHLHDVLANCRAAGIPYKTIPSHGALLSGKVRYAMGQDFSPEDLLGRESVRLNEDHIRGHIKGRCVLVTGAAGSVGSELCRQIARFEPMKLIAFDQAESDLFKLDLELRKNYPELNLLAEIGDIRDPKRISDLIARKSVTSLFHAAAYKHVPLMEANILEAANNNILGTWNVVRAAREHNVSDFLMISTDKAVRPTSVMGATKRVAEIITSATPSQDSEWQTKFVSVRFGNVLGSNGSVVPIFQAQIAAGGPVTVTHPDACRYFMTTREAVQLILQASTMGKGADIFVLDMGEPVRIRDLARNMIQLSGFVPDRDIEISYTGLRPGEKIYEELISEGENIVPTYHQKIKIYNGPRLSCLQVDGWIEQLRLYIQDRNELAIIAHIQELVAEYQPAVQWQIAGTCSGTSHPENVNASDSRDARAVQETLKAKSVGTGAGLGTRLPHPVEGLS